MKGTIKGSSSWSNRGSSPAVSDYARRAVPVVPYVEVGPDRLDVPEPAGLPVHPRVPGFVAVESASADTCTAVPIRNTALSGQVPHGQDVCPAEEDSPVLVRWQSVR